VATNVLEQYAAFISGQKKLEAVCFSETLVTTYRTTQCHSRRTQSKFSMKASNIKIYLVVVYLTFYAYKKYRNSGFVDSSKYIFAISLFTP
jgi:hypothetical protein